MILQEITVTGTHISGVAPIAPITTITAQDIQDTGLPDLGSVIRTQPQFYSGGQNVGAIVGGGLNAGEPFTEPDTANLRGLGAGATLTLIDGHRMAGNGAYVDLSSIPTAAVDRVDVDTSGASAIYGADAVAGVVNITLKKSYEGAQTDAYVGGTMNGGLTQRYSQLLGITSDDRSAGMMLGYQFQSLDEILASQRTVSSGAGSVTALQPQDKSNAVFLSAHYQPAQRLDSYLEGVYNHRTSLDLWDIGDYQTLEDQFWLNGGARIDVARHQTINVDVTWSGDSNSSLAYGPSVGVFAPIDRLAAQARRLGVDLAGQGELIRLGGGRVVKWAAGTGFAKSLLDGQSAATAPTVSSRRKEHAYLELNVPAVPRAARRVGLERLTLNVAGRFEHSSDFGSITVPKIGLAYAPIRTLTLSGTWGRSFQEPALYQLNGQQEIVREPGSYFIGVPADMEVLVLTGGNPGLRPQTATTRMLSVNWRPGLRALRGIDAEISYYDTDFSGRISNPISNLGDAIVNPLYARFVVMNPSAALQDQVLNGGATYENLLGLPVNPTDVAALVNNTDQNLSGQVIHGVDATVTWRKRIREGDLMIAAAASWLRFDQQTIAGGGLQQISGTIFNPPKFKSRMSLGWENRDWVARLMVNFISGEVNTTTNPVSWVGSWTTMDTQVGYRIRSLDLRVSVQNLLNRAPPQIPASAALIPPGIGFDADNYSAIGRFLSFEASARW